MSQTPIGVGLIGCGKISRKHAHVIGQIDDLRLVAVHDVVEERAAAVAARFPGARVAPDLESISRDPEIDIGVVCTPSGLHARQGATLARAGKHVIVEKPMALRLEEADQLIEVCDRYGVKLFVVKQNRYNVPVRRAREAIESGRMGRVFLGDVRVLWNRSQEYYDEEPWRGTWQLDGGVLTNQASHHIDLLIWMMGEVESVFARGRTVMHRIEVEDTGVVLLKFRGGGLGVVEASTCIQPADLEGSIQLYGEKGTIEIGGFAATELKTWRFDEPTEEDARIFETHAKNPEEFAFNHREFYLDVVDTLRRRRHALIDGIEGRKSLEVINAIYESMETGHEVYLRFEPRRCRLGETGRERPAGG
jgi:UDP-N-acetyl-2-amino-2-deoxyglucuronate dehydrogenase